jgi:DNA-binding MarR family transcriptional regulator
VGLADRLVRESYARRKRDENDRRKVVLELTNEGESVLERLSSAHHAQLRQIGPQIRKILDRLGSEKKRPSGRRTRPG